jgi:PAS domain S-box-containing protein
MPSVELSKIFTLLDTVPLGAYVFQLEDCKSAESLRVLYANSASEHMIDVKPSAVVGTLVDEYFPHATDVQGLAASICQSIVNQTPHNFGLISYGDKHFTEQLFTLSIFPLGPDIAVAMFDNHSASSSLNTELDAIVEFSVDSIVSWDLDGTILTWNHAAERLFGYTSAEAIRQPMAMLLPTDRLDEITHFLEQLKLGNQIELFETQRLRKDGTVIDVVLTVSPIVDRNAHTVGATTVAHDLGRRKHNEAHLQQYAAIVSASFDAVASVSLHGHVLSWNAAAEELFGYSADEMIGSSVYDMNFESLFEAGTNLEDLQARSLRGERSVPFAVRAKRKDHSEVVVSVAVSPIIDGLGDVVGIAAAIRDMTEQHRLELQIRQSQKMEAVGLLTGSIAHDFNNVLHVIRGYSAILMKDVKDEETREGLRHIDQAAQHAAEFTRQLLAYSRQQVLVPELVDLNEVAETELKFLDPMMGDTIRVMTDLKPGIDKILVDRTQLEQIILNLTINARDAMPEGGTLCVSTSKVEVSEKYAASHNGSRSGPHLLLQFSDSGVGMDDDTLRRIFDPFFTTKPEGTGLGLATVFGIVKQNGGHLSVSSRPGLGTTFRLYFPLSLEPLKRAVDTSNAGRLRGHETILLVEDAKTARLLVAEMLMSYGYTVLEASNGAEALQAARDHAGSISLLLTNVIMPEMNGQELADQLLAQIPELKVLYMSGYPADTVIRQGVMGAGSAMIELPWLPEELASAVRDTLDHEVVATGEEALTTLDN